MTRYKRFFSLILAFVMVLSAMPIVSAAAPQSSYEFEGSLPESVKAEGSAKLSISDKMFYTGKSSLLTANRKSAADGFSIDLSETVAVGAEYTVTAWVCLNEGVSGKLGMFLKKDNGEELRINSANLSGGSWAKISGSIKPELTDSDSLRLVVCSADGGKFDFYTDCLTIDIKGSKIDWSVTQEEGVNLLSDSSFESGTTGAAASRFSTINATDEASKEGSCSVAVTDRKETYSGIEFDVKDLLLQDCTYKASVFLKLKKGAPESHMYFQLELKEQGQEVRYPIIGGGRINDKEWTELSGLIHTADFAYPLERVKMYVASMDENKNDFYADAFSLSYTRETGEEDKAKITEFPEQPVENPVMPVYINWYDEKQTIDGFGGSGAFGTANAIRKMSDKTAGEVLDLLFTDKGAGLTIVRNMVNPSISPKKGVYDWTQGEDQIWLMKEAQKRGVPTIMSTVWSPPPWMKTTDSVIGGELKEECYGDYAEYLAEYITQYERQFGITIDIISMANEPNLSPEYDGCLWNDKQITKWIRDYAAPVFAEKGITARLMAAEDMNFSEARVADALLDPQAAQRLDIVGVHGYGGGYSKLTVSENADKPIWMTEVLGYHEHSNTIMDGLVWAKRIHQHMAIANVSAWNYWYFANTEKRSNGSLIVLDTATDTYLTPKRFYTIANYSRFVKPDDVRISATMEPGENVFVTAFKNKNENRLTFVAVNGNVNEQKIKLNLNGANASSFDTYITDENNNLTKAAVSAAGEITLPPRSVITFVSKVTDAQAVPVEDYMGADVNITLPEIVASQGTPVIDGKIDSVWTGAQVVSTDVWGDGSVNTTGAQAKVRALWDSNNYYVLMEVKDNNLSADNEQAYMQDCVEIFLDENNAHTGFYQEDDVQYRINCFNQATFTDNCNQAQFTSAVVKTNNGYIVEAAIPFTEVTPKAGMIMGTEFQVTDEYSGNTRSIAKWATDSGNSYYDTATFGVLRLGGNDEISVIYNDKRLQFDVSPALVNDRTMVPFRKIFEEFGAAVDYIAAEEKVIAEKDGLRLELLIGNTTAIVNGTAVTLEAPPFVKEDRTLVPLRFTAEALGAEVKWDEATNTVYIDN